MSADKETKQLNSLDRQLRNAAGKGGAQPHRWRPRHALRGRALLLLPRRLNATKIPKSRPIEAIRWPAGVPLPTAGRKMGATGQAVKEEARPSPSPPLLG